jgi:hypothetical protein
MATQPKPKPKPEPEPPEPGDDDAALHRADDGETLIEEPKSLSERIDAIFNSQIALMERVEKLEEHVAAPPVRIGRHVAGNS